jgi:hypothetical protein
MSKLLIASLFLVACAPAPQASTAHTLPSVERIGNRMDLVPDGQKILLHLCTDVEGRVTSVDVEHGSPLNTFDTAVKSDVLAWQFEPQSAPSCRKMTIVYHPA